MQTESHCKDAHILRARVLLSHVANAIGESKRNDGDEDWEPTNTLSLSHASSSTTSTTIRIGDVSIVMEKTRPEISHAVPIRYLNKNNESQNVLRTLRFLLQKDSLSQVSSIVLCVDFVYTHLSGWRRVRKSVI